MALRTSRCILTIAVLGTLLTVAQAQQIDATEDSIFDEAPPSLADNLPPDANPEDILNAQTIEAETVVPVQPSIRSEMMPFNSRRIHLMEALQQPLSSVSINHNAVKLNQPQLVAEFYRREQFPTIWTHETVPNPIIAQLQEAIKASADDALNPNRYHANIINYLQAGTHYQDITALEILLTDAWLSLVYDLANGIVDAKKIDRTWNAPKVSHEQLAAWLAEGINAQDVLSPIQAINAQDTAYQALKQQYILNRDQQLKTDDLVINMERIRWMAQDWHEQRYIFVNIPSYEVTVVENDKNIYQTKAVVGRKDRATPRFVDRMRHVVMSPTWTVPPTIMRKDKLPQLIRNPAAFNGSYEAISPSGKVVRPSDVNWSSAGTSYRLRQKPGGQNALGRVKFLFPNEHAIYLHDTPSKGLFGRSNRALSSGCIRLQDPMDFANLLLKGSSWTPEKIKTASNQSKEQWANLQKQTPVYLVYWTTWADPSGNIRSAKDVYELDAKLTNAYKKALVN